jgi:hypothetical protein
MPLKMGLYLAGGDTVATNVTHVRPVARNFLATLCVAAVGPRLPSDER